MNIRTKSDLEKIREEGLKFLYPGEMKISVGMATCGLSTGAGKVYEAIQKEIEKSKVPILLGRTGCIGFCQREPVVDILEPGKPRVFYQGVTPERFGELVQKWLENKVVEDLLLCKMEKEDRILEGSVKDYPIKEILTFVARQVASAVEIKRNEQALRRSEARYRFPTFPDNRLSN